MQLTRFTDYSLRVLVYLGAHPERLCTISEIADAYRISENHLMKVVNRLASSGYIETVRGKGGGMHLSRAPKMINIGAVVRDMEERFDIVECFREEPGDCPLLPACALRSVLADARHNFLSTVDRYTLQDVIGSGVSSSFAQAKSALQPIAIKPMR
ncbi:MAG TPA: Rrf2 family transcriptional regulator [Burkholderiaceae bacterium]|nr:Rrf2 family transcriptional regulator [Burkholderiaceae bacterium]